MGRRGLTVPDCQDAELIEKSQALLKDALGAGNVSVKSATDASRTNQQPAHSG
jgi:hypothetical protein